MFTFKCNKSRIVEKKSYDETEKLYDETINNVCKVSYEQEKDRADTILTKSHNLIYYLSIIFSTITIISTLIFKQDVSFIVFTNKYILFSIAFIYLKVILLIFLTLGQALNVQHLDKSKSFPKGKEFYEKILSNKELNSKKLIISFYDVSIDSLIKNNDKNVKYLDIAYYLYNLIFLNIIYFIATLLTHLILKDIDIDLIVLICIITLFILEVKNFNDKEINIFKRNK